MAGKQRKMRLQYPEEEEEEEAMPVSPLGQYFNSSVLCIYIVGVLEFEVPFDESQAIPLLKHLFLPINPRFSSIMVEGKRGEKQWKKVEVNLEDHINIPLFPEDKSKESYDECFANYLSRIAIEALPQNRPLWEIHIFNYQTSSAASANVPLYSNSITHLEMATLSWVHFFLVFKELTIPLFPWLSLPSNLQNPLTKDSSPDFFGLSSAYNTVSDLMWSVLKSSVIQDDETPIRSGPQVAEPRPITISTMAFFIDQIKLIKSRFGVTINDVMTGIIFYGTRLYMQNIDYKSRAATSTALVLLNTRNTEGYQSVSEMLNAGAKGPWGNRISFLHVPIPKLEESRVWNPLEFVWEAHHIIKRKKQSLAVPLTGIILDIESRVKGHEAVAKHVHNTLTMSSTVITNLVGPSQQMSLSKRPVKGLYFTLAGGPESLVISIMSYMGVLRVTLKTEKYFIDEQKLKSSIKSAFEIILKAAMEIPLQIKI